MHIYAFGSVCRGEIDKYSDIDLLAITSDRNNQLDPMDYSIYSYSRIQKLWEEGNAFSWHLFKESRLLYASNNFDFLKELGEPSTYTNGIYDCHKFFQIFESASDSLLNSNTTQIYDLSIIFLAIRNFSTCYALSCGNFIFSRNSAKMLGDKSLFIDNTNYEVLERARLLSTRGEGVMISSYEIESVVEEINQIRNWMKDLIKTMKAVIDE